MSNMREKIEEFVDEFMPERDKMSRKDLRDPHPLRKTEVTMRIQEDNMGLGCDVLRLSGSKKNIKMVFGAYSLEVDRDELLGAVQSLSE